MHKSGLKTLLFSLATLLFSCDKDIYERRIKSDIELEVIQEDGQNILVASTEESYPCSNFAIAYTLESDNSSFKIKFDHIKDTETCLTSIGPAKALINLANYSDKEYSVTFVHRSKKSKGTYNPTTGSLQITSNKNVRIK